MRIEHIGRALSIWTLSKPNTNTPPQVDRSVCINGKGSQQAELVQEHDLHLSLIPQRLHDIFPRQALIQFFHTPFVMLSVIQTCWRPLDMLFFGFGVERDEKKEKEQRKNDKKGEKKPGNAKGGREGDKGSQEDKEPRTKR